MSVLFTVPFDGVIIHVLQIRGRTGFLARDLGMAAGYVDEGQGFIDLICREWASSLDEDDDIAQLVGAELDVLKREVPLPPTTTTALVLFSTGAERALLRSRVRNARSLLGFLHSEVLSRVVSLGQAPTGDDDDGSGGAPVSPTAPLPRVAAPPPPRVTLLFPPALTEAVNQLSEAQDRLANAAETQRETARLTDALERQLRAYEVLSRLAGDLREMDLISCDQWAALRVEAAEELLGRRLRSPLPSFGDETANAPLAA